MCFAINSPIAAGNREETIAKSGRRGERERERGERSVGKMRFLHCGGFRVSSSKR